VELMGRRQVGPSPPEPDWDRLDLRGLNSTRHAWGYLAPDDSAIVSDDGKVYIRVERKMVERPKDGTGAIIRLLANKWAVLKRCLRWSRIIKELYEFEQDVQEDRQALDEASTDTSEVVMASLVKNQNLPTVPTERKSMLTIRRFKV
jgi:hypothetical protein